MNVDVVVVMIVFVSVDIFYMGMLVLVGLVSIRSPQAPDEIHEPERDEQPGGQVAAKAFDDLQLVDRNSKRYPDKAQHD